MSRPEIVEDVMAERRAAGITVAPEAALHRALQARTDELERVRSDLRAMEAERTDAACDRDAALASRNEARAINEGLELRLARAERDHDEALSVLGALASWVGHGPGGAETLTPAAYDARIREGVDMLILVERDRAQVERADTQAEAADTYSTLIRERDEAVDEVVRLVRERDEARAEAATDGPAYNAGRSEGRADVAAELRAILDPDDIQHWNITGLLGHVRGLARSLAIACDLGSVTSSDIAREKVRQAIAPIPLTAPDVAPPCAPAAGAADPPRAHRPLSAEAQAIRRPRPPDELVGALHDATHPPSGRLLATTPIRLPVRLSGLAAPRPLATWWPANDSRTRTR